MSKENLPIKVLHLEDLPTDAELVSRVLRMADREFEIKVVDTRLEFEAALREFKPEIIISDHSLPTFNSLEAIDILKRSGLDIPFILVTGTVSDEFASQAIKMGAVDYILKDRLQRLPSALFGALDISRMEKERLETEKKVRETEKQYFDLIQRLPAAVYTCDIQGRILLYNNAAAELWGCSPAGTKETWCGSSIMLDGYGRKITPSASPMARAIKEGKSIFGEEIIIERPDGTRRHVLSHPSPNFNSAGDIVGGTDMLIDITDRKRAELQTLTLVDSLQSRNKELSQFAYMVSHHLRAPIARILGLASIFDTNPDENTFIVEKIIEGTHELDEVVRDINLVISARNPELETMEYVSFEKKLRLITKVMEKEITESRAWITSDFADAPKAFTNSNFLYSMISNLLSNALKFRSPDRPLHVHLKSFKVENFICLSIKDNGRGIDMEKNAKHVFSIYKRFHGNSIPGKGVGLHLVKAQVEALGGKIELGSEINEGTEFRIYLPISYEIQGK